MASFQVSSKSSSCFTFKASERTLYKCSIIDKYLGEICELHAICIAVEELVQ